MTMVYSYIYIIENKINGKKYVGQSVDVEHRWAQHRSSAKAGGKVALHKAIRKYGEENFYLSIIDKGYSKEEVNSLEIHYIAKYNTFRGNGYNMAIGGEGNGKGKDNPNFGRKHSEASKLKMSKSQKMRNNHLSGKGPMFGKKFTEEHKKKLSDAAKKRIGILNSGFGKKRSKETRRKISESQKGKIIPEKQKKILREVNLGNKNRAHSIIQLSLDGEFIAKHESLKVAAEKINIKGTGNISNCCSGKRRTCGGYKWKYEENYTD